MGEAKYGRCLVPEQLCYDEMQVTDGLDTVRLQRLDKWLFFPRIIDPQAVEKRQRKLYASLNPGIARRDELWERAFSKRPW